MKKENLSFVNDTPKFTEPSQFNIDINELSNIRCPNCNNQVFQSLHVAKKISAIQSPTGKDAVLPIQIFACTNCGAVPRELGGTFLEQDAQKSLGEYKDEK